MKSNMCLKLVLIGIMLCFSIVLLSKEFVVGVLYWSMNIPGQVAMRQGLEKEVGYINHKAKTNKQPFIKLVPMVAGDGEKGIENQISQMNQLIASKVDMIIVQPTDNAALSIPLQKANQAGIPVVAYDQYISGGNLTAYRTSDNYTAGFLNGEYIASLYKGKKEIKLVLVEYPHVSSTVERLNGFLDALTEYGSQYHVLKNYIAVEPVSGQKAGKAMLKDYPAQNSIDVVFCVNDGGGLAVVEELQKAGRKEIKVASVDGDPNSVENIKKGRSTVIDCAQFCGPLGAEAVRCAYQYLTTGKTPYHALVPVFPITKGTLNLYPGWQGPLPKSFVKPWFSHKKEWTGQLRIKKE